MQNPTKEEIEEFISGGENAPKTKTLDENGIKSVIAEIENAVSNMPEQKVEETKYVEDKEVCPHCDTEFDYKVKEGNMTAVCTDCGKTVPLCGKCEDHTKCSDCIYCDLANFYNYLRGKNTIEQFLGGMNPPLTDMTVSSNQMFVPTYEGFTYDEGGDNVEWDMKYWEIYGKIYNSMLSADTEEEDVLSFVREIVEMNRA